MSGFRKYVLPLFVYLLLATALFPYYQWYVNNPDSFQYLQIAKHYLDGYCHEAINGYWNPLQSWLLIPFLWIGDPVRGMKILMVLEGALALGLWTNWIHRFALNRFFRNLLIFGVIPFLLSYAFLNPTADLLFMALVFCLPISLDALYSENRLSNIWFGFSGALLFFAKAFGLPLFIFWTITAVIYERRINRRFPKRRQLFSSAVAFLLPVLIWCALLSGKYGHITISEAARFNMTKEVAPLPGQIMHLPLLSGGLVKPAGEHALSAWEEPMQVLSLHPLHPFSSTSDAKFYERVIERNILTIWYYDFKRQAGIIFVVITIFFVTVTVRRRKIDSVDLENNSFVSEKKAEWSPVLYAALLLFFFYAGYSLVLVHTRYIWICTLLMLLLTSWMISEMTDVSGGATKFAGRFAMCMVLLLALKRPVKEILFTIDKDYPIAELWNGIRHPIRTIYHTTQADRRVHRLALEFKNKMNEPGAIVSIGEFPGDRHTYSASLFTAFYGGHPYFGQMEPGRDSLTPDVSYFLVWDSKLSAPTRMSVLYVDQLTGARLFELSK